MNLNLTLNPIDKEPTEHGWYMVLEFRKETGKLEMASIIEYYPEYGWNTMVCADGEAYTDAAIDFTDEDHTEGYDIFWAVQPRKDEIQ